MYIHIYICIYIYIYMYVQLEGPALVALFSLMMRCGVILSDCDKVSLEPFKLE